MCAYVCSPSTSPYRPHKHWLHFDFWRYKLCKDPTSSGLPSQDLCFHPYVFLLSLFFLLYLFFLLFRSPPSIFLFSHPSWSGRLYVCLFISFIWFTIKSPMLSGSQSECTLGIRSMGLNSRHNSQVLLGDVIKISSVAACHGHATAADRSSATFSDRLWPFWGDIQLGGEKKLTLDMREWENREEKERKRDGREIGEKKRGARVPKE